MVGKGKGKGKYGRSNTKEHDSAVKSPKQRRKKNKGVKSPLGIQLISSGQKLAGELSTDITEGMHAVRRAVAAGMEALTSKSPSLKKTVENNHMMRYLEDDSWDDEPAGPPRDAPPAPADEVKYGGYT